MIMSSAGSDAKCISTCGYYWDKNPNSIYGPEVKTFRNSITSGITARTTICTTMSTDLMT